MELFPHPSRSLGRRRATGTTKQEAPMLKKNCMSKGSSGPKTNETRSNRDNPMMLPRICVNREIGERGSAEGDGVRITGVAGAGGAGGANGGA
jgi:hypothetical protein